MGSLRKYTEKKDYGKLIRFLKEVKETSETLARKKCKQCALMLTFYYTSVKF